MITYTDTEFQRHLTYLVKKVAEVEGQTAYAVRTEIMGLKEASYDDDQISCGSCHTPISLKNHCTWRDTGFIKYLDNITGSPCCGPTLNAKLCPFVCVGCQRIALFLTPHISKEINYEYTPGRIHHIDRCSECDGSDGMISKILEVCVHKHLNKIT